MQDKFFSHFVTANHEMNAENVLNADIANQSLWDESLHHSIKVNNQNSCRAFSVTAS